MNSLRKAQSRETRARRIRQIWKQATLLRARQTHGLWKRPIRLFFALVGVAIFTGVLGGLFTSFSSTLDHITQGQFFWVNLGGTLSLVAKIVAIAALTLSLLYLLVRFLKSHPATGFGEKKLWDWMELLIVPFVLTIGGLYFGGIQASNRAAVEDQRAQDTALEAYFDEMGGLVMHENLNECGGDKDVRALAEAQTSTVLGRVDGDRKGAVIKFLYGANLIDKGCPIVSLAGTDLVDVQLSGVDLSQADLSGANMTSANLEDARLKDAVLADAWLGYTEGDDQPMGAANLRGANLRNIDLSGAVMNDADLGLPLSDAGNHTNLRMADLRGAVLDDADLREADLTKAELSGASMRGTEFQDAKGITREKLEQQAKTLEGAMMPDGSAHD